MHTERKKGRAINYMPTCTHTFGMIYYVYDVLPYLCIVIVSFHLGVGQTLRMVMTFFDISV